MAQYPKMNSLARTGCIIFGILEVQVVWSLFWGFAGVLEHRLGQGRPRVLSESSCCEEQFSKDAT